jgi:hypothetical protein
MTTNNHRDTMPAPRPLWHIMQEAYFRGRDPGHSERHGYAAELRALADVVAPKEDEPLLPFIEPDYAMGARIRGQRIRALLLAEAKRAEKGGDADD